MPPSVAADSLFEFVGMGGVREQAASGALIGHESEVSALEIGGSATFQVGALVSNFSGVAAAQGSESFSVNFSLAEATTVRLSNDATIGTVVASPQVLGQAVLSLAAGGQVLSLPLFEDGSVQALLQPGDYVFTASSAVTARAFPIVAAGAGFDGGYSFSLVHVPEAEHFGLAAAAALLGFGLWRRRAAGR